MASFFTRVPLARSNLFHRPLRFAVYLAGIAFAVLLMFVQLGFWNALFDSVVALIQKMQADLVIVNRAKLAMAFDEPFPLRRLVQAREVPDVARVEPLYVRLGSWKTPCPPRRWYPGQEPKASHQLIRVVGCNPASGALTFEELSKHVLALKIPGTALVDDQSKKEFRIPKPFPDKGFNTELNGQPVRVIGTFTLGTDFATNGTLILSQESYAQFFPSPSGDALQDVEIGLVSLRPGADPKKVCAALNGVLPNDVVVMTHADFVEKEIAYWRNNTPVGFVFILGLIVGFVVGVIICSQILSTDVGDHLPEYATLKAVGYTNTYLTWVILQEALWLSVLGFLPGWVLSKGVYLLLAPLTGLPLELRWDASLEILGVTVVMCTISGLLAVGKVWYADPAEVF